MKNAVDLMDIDLKGLRWDGWTRAASTVGAARGFFQDLGPDHAALFIEEGDTLLVTFENCLALQFITETGTPLGWDMVEAAGWSHLSIVARRDSWYRDDAVFEFFDHLIDDGFFDEFERVVFFGAGPGGYAAAAFSVAAPGARVLALQPQATLDPRRTEWEDRFPNMRRTNFSERYGYAPDMLEAAKQAYVLYDPYQRLDAMHAALFARPNVQRLRMTHMGSNLQRDLYDIDLLESFLEAVADDTLDSHSFARMMRARRGHVPYLRNLLTRLEAQGRDGFAEMLCENVVNRMSAPRFRRKLDAIRAARVAAEAKDEPPQGAPDDGAGDAPTEPPMAEHAAVSAGDDTAKAS